MPRLKFRITDAKSLTALSADFPAAFCHKARFLPCKCNFAGKTLVNIQNRRASTVTNFNSAINDLYIEVISMPGEKKKVEKKVENAAEKTGEAVGKGLKKGAKAVEDVGKGIKKELKKK